MIIRRFQVTDANEISALFREIYAERYVYSDLYVPAMITWRNTQHDWYSAVAVINNKIIGHAALRRENNHATCAELAMIVIHPMAQHRGIAFKLGKYLFDEAHKQQLTTLTIKMVCSHSRSQQLAINLGFHTTALLRDYVSSPFESGHFESVVVGVQALQPRPVPTLGKMNGQPNTLSLLSVPFGNKSPSSIESTRHAFPIEITDVNARINVIIHQVTQGIINEVSELPHGRLIYLQVPINSGLAKYHPVLYQAGYRDAGLILDNSGEWFWLFQRGFKRQHFQLCCPIAQKLQTDLFLN